MIIIYMKRISLSLTNKYIEKFDEIKELTSLNKSELVRRWIDQELEKLKRNDTD